MTPRSGSFVRPPTLTATVVDHIRASIVQGHFAPGAPLHEVELSTQLGVSRGTVREALRQLRDENLVEIVPHRGACVPTLSPRRAWEIYTLRSQLEPYAVRLAMERAAYRAQDLDELDALVHHLGELQRQGDPVNVVSTDMEFHRVLCERSEHGLLLDALRRLRFQTRQFILNTLLYRSDREQDERTHRVILDTIRAGDPLRAEVCVREHIINAGTYLVRLMESSDGRAASPMPRTSAGILEPMPAVRSAKPTAAGRAAADHRGAKERDRRRG
jgi:DNA-binding GntR family transcriptional regulator